ncbi:helix-turn-helix domain-containing protein [Pseudomonas aeruginosa]|uniref:helix-turn-helix domain-containing protein n=1 Tax=Pseudomonas aeruginosa TaxID=287 RepID=UPI000EAD6028|nr:S24 family peptidase [Pseudomonas aeruginosa]UAC81911.1 helix-turn-helix domain-containing protein [Pseudomonas aeruginosa]HBO2747336.1 helix-turn-helix transcriptional regulator [Pseudomonas aeruginosa]
MDFSDRLNQRMDALGISASDISREIKVSKGTLSHWTNGTNKARGKNLIALAKVLQCSASWLETGKGEKDLPSHEGYPSEADYALIPQLTAKGSSGNGYLNDHVEVKGGLAFKRDWLRRMGLRAENLRAAYNHGDSNWPTLSDGEVVLIDVSCKEPTNGKMFALYDADQEVIFKRLIREISGGWLIRSDNQDKNRYPDQPVTDDGMRSVDIIGRIVWRGGAM